MYEAETIQQLQDIEFAIKEGDASTVAAFDSIKKSIDELAKKLQTQMDRDADWRDEDKTEPEPDTSNPYEGLEQKLDNIQSSLDSIKAVIDRVPDIMNKIVIGIVYGTCAGGLLQTNGGGDMENKTKQFPEFVNYIMKAVTDNKLISGKGKNGSGPTYGGNII